MIQAEQFILEFLEERHNDENLHEVHDFFEKQKILESKSDIQLVLHIISKTTDNIIRTPHFFDNIILILRSIEKSIHNYFSNCELFYIIDLIKNTSLAFQI